MQSLKPVVLLAVASLLGCSNVHSLWHDQTLPSGKAIKVTSFHLVWGVEHDERNAGNDCFALEFVSADSKADPAAQEHEALEVFELIRPVSELWGFKSAYLSGFPTLERKGRYDIFTFSRGSDGRWTFSRQSAKVFANE